MHAGVDDHLRATRQALAGHDETFARRIARTFRRQLSVSQEILNAKSRRRFIEFRAPCIRWLKRFSLARQPPIPVPFACYDEIWESGGEQWN
jgi:hypothetical protein